MHGAVVNKMGQRVAKVKAAFDATAGSQKVTVTQGCDARVLVLVLSSEWDANRRATEAAQIKLRPPGGL